MTRQTSVETYRQIEAEGLLSALRFEVYKIVYDHGPLTAHEAWHIYRARLTKDKPGRDGITQRFSELERLGVIQNLGTKFCSITGRKAIVWNTTNSLPVKETKPTRIKCSYCEGKGYVEQLKLL